MIRGWELIIAMLHLPTNSYKLFVDVTAAKTNGTYNPVLKNALRYALLRERSEL